MSRKNEIQHFSLHSILQTAPALQDIWRGGLTIRILPLLPFLKKRSEMLLLPAAAGGILIVILFLALFHTMWESRNVSALHISFTFGAWMVILLSIAAGITSLLAFAKTKQAKT